MIHRFSQVKSCTSVSSLSLRIIILTHEFQLIRTKRQDSADVVSNGQWEEGDEEQEEQNPPEAEILHELLPCGAKAGEHAVTAVEVRVEERMTLHGTERKKRNKEIFFGE